MTNLSTSNWPDLGPVDVVLVPLGSTEQHGPHLPFDTDTVIAAAVSEGVASELEKAGVAAVVAPAIAVGSSGEHQGFVGTISMGNEALRLVVLEVARSVKNWSPRVFFVNGHGGNVPVLADVVSQLQSEEHLAQWAPCGVPGQDAHAGREETSVMLYLRPDSVRMQFAEPGDTRALADILPSLRDGGVKAVSANGVLGDPTGASVKEGAELLTQMVGEVLSRLRSSWPGLA